MTSLHARLAALEAKATKGPWHYSPGDASHDDSLTAPTGPLIVDGAYAETGYTIDADDAALIVATRNALPAIMRILAAAEALSEFTADIETLSTRMSELGAAVRAANEAIQ